MVLVRGGMVVQCLAGMLPAQGEQRAGPRRNRRSFSALLKKGDGAIHLFLGSKEVNHESVGRVIHVSVFAEFRSQQGGSPNTDGRFLGVSLRHGIFCLRLESRKLSFGIDYVGRTWRNRGNEQEERYGAGQGSPNENAILIHLHSCNENEFGIQAVRHERGYMI